ncbi:uncharacterized protein JCM6883_003474 [Sporobolomyces salmoneus]|uniref:uncharacterized protein n=1 Tax=Sporobolomyces salmoneus TaxID=183962 RepID=UPI003177BA75
MFSSKSRKAQEATAGLDFSSILRNPSAWNLGHLSSLGIGGELTAMTYDPVQSLLAVGTEHGKLFVFGAPGVQLSWDIGIPTKIRHLAFKAGSGFLCVVDAKDTLYVFDLNRIDKNRPHRDSMLSLRSKVTCLEASASHAFLFLGLADGTIDIFDIDRGVLSREVRIPNLWLAQEELLRRSGVPDAPSRRHIPICTDLKSHPTDLNLLLIAYEGGVSLWNLATQTCERNFDFVVPPGAPGGGNDADEALFMERRPPVTCLAWRPDGLIFAAGHEDGTISFASAQDETPISMRTLERADVNKTTEEDLFGWSQGGGQRQLSGREPIFRLAWSGFPEETYLDQVTSAIAGASSSAIPSSSSSAFAVPASPSLSTEEKTNLHGETMLTVMGGILPADPTGIHVLEFPAYSPPASAASTSKSGNIPLPVREALRASISPNAHHLYPTSTPPEDFLLLPRTSPHFSLSFDPNAILITTGRDRRFPVLASPHAINSIEAWSFPPSSLHVPQSLSLPSPLSFSGGGTCSSTKLVTVSNATYRKMLHQFDVSDELSTRLPTRGGTAFPQPRPRIQRNDQSAPRMSDNHARILITLHIDLVVRFWDVSSHLLWGYKATPESEPKINLEYPRPLRHLDVDLKSALSDSRALELSSARLLRDRPWELELDKVSFAEETLELGVSLSTGDVMVFKWGYGELPQMLEEDRVEAEAALDDTVQGALRDLNLDSNTTRPPPPHPSFDSSQAQRRQSHSKLSRHRGSVAAASPSFDSSSHDPQDLYVDLRDAPVLRLDQDSFRPIAGFKFSSSLGEGAPSSKTCLAMSDIGFFAASNEANLVVVDMRGPEVLFFDGPHSQPVDHKGKGKHKVDSTSISSLTWTISAIGEDGDHSPRLIVTHDSGLTRIFEVANLGGSWHLNQNFASCQHDSTRGAFATFVLDKYGNELPADGPSLQRALDHQASFSAHNHEAKGSLMALWVTASPRSLSVFYNIDGPKIASYEDDRVVFERAVVVRKQDCSVLVTQAKNRQVSVFSLPELIQISRMSPDASVHDSAGDIALCKDGDFVQHLDPLDIRLYTTCDTNRPAFPPKLTVVDPSIPIPAQISALTWVGSALGSWFGGAKMYTGAEVDAILGGPNRPPPKNRPLPGAPPPIISATKRAKPTPQPPTQASYVQGASESARDIMTRTNEALAMRGEYLNSIGEKLSSVGADAAKFAQQTKASAQREGAKRALAGGWSSLWNKMP